MKKTFLIASSILLYVTSAFSQEQPRRFDNSAPSVICQSSAKCTETAAAPSKQVVNVQPLQSADKTLVKKTAMVTANAGSEALVKAAAAATATYLKGYSTGNIFIDSFIVDSSLRYNVDPLLIFSQMNQESSFKVRATSHKGAAGLMQLMPATARRLGVTNIYDPQQNIEGGVRYMRMLLDMFNGDVDLALAGYNAGEGAVIKFDYQIPPYAETRDYVKRISVRYRSISSASTADQNKIVK